MPADFMGSQFLNWAQSPYAPSSYTQTASTSPLGNQLRYMPAWSPVSGGLLGGGGRPRAAGDSGNTAPALNPGPPPPAAPSGDIQNDSSMDWAGALDQILSVFSGPGFTPPGSIIDANAPMPQIDMTPPTGPDPNPFPDYMAQLAPEDVAIIDQNQPIPAFDLSLPPDVTSLEPFAPGMMNVPMGATMGPSNPVGDFSLSLGDTSPLSDALSSPSLGVTMGPNNPVQSISLSPPTMSRRTRFGSFRDVEEDKDDDDSLGGFRISSGPGIADEDVSEWGEWSDLGDWGGGDW
jgi:hypothetical protein